VLGIGWMRDAGSRNRMCCAGSRLRGWVHESLLPQRNVSE
jgi:hypothetical protein